MRFESRRYAHGGFVLAPNNPVSSLNIDLMV